MEVGAAGPLGTPVFKGRNRGAENAITRLPVEAGSPVSESQRKASNARRKNCSICGNGDQISWQLHRTQRPLQEAWDTWLLLLKDLKIKWRFLPLILLLAVGSVEGRRHVWTACTCVFRVFLIQMLQKAG